MFRFANPEYFYLLLLLPLMAGLLVYIKYNYNKRLRAFGNIETLKKLMPEASWGNIRNKFILLMAAFVFIILALARPQTGARYKEVERKGVELMFVVDVSNSMLAEDFKPSRLERTKNSINRLLDRFTNDRVGLIVFAGKPFIQLPITSDYTVAKSFVDYISPNMVPEQGTEIAAALRLARISFSQQSENSRAVILISDGETHDEGALKIVEEMAKEGIIVNTVGIGTPEGTSITIGGEQIKDENGNIVVTKLNEQLLKEIAINGNGTYVRASNASMGLEEVVRNIKSLDQKTYSTAMFEEYDELFQYFLAVALILLVLEFFVLERKNRIIARMHLFNIENKEN